MSIKSPGGSLFPYYYKGGEIHCLKYGSFFRDQEALFLLMDSEKEFIQNKPNHRLRIWTDFYETEVTDDVLTRYISHISALSDQIIKLAIVGLNGANQRSLKRRAKKLEAFPPFQFFKDPEDGKTWLVSE